MASIFLPLPGSLLLYFAERRSLCLVSGRVPGYHAALPWPDLLDLGGGLQKAPAAGLLTSFLDSRRGA